MRVAVAWQPPACAPEPLRPRSHLCLHSALLPVGPDGQARRGQWREVAPVSALVKSVSLPLKVDCGLRVSGEERQALSQACLGRKENLWFQPPAHSIHFSQCLPCSTQSSLVSLKSPKEPWGWAVFAILGEETDAQRVCQSNLQL